MTFSFGEGSRYPHQLGATFEEAFAEAVERMQARSEKLKPCIVVRHRVTDRFFQCIGGYGMPIRLEVPWCPGSGNRTIPREQIAGYFYRSLMYREVEATVGYDWEECRIEGVNLLVATKVGAYARRLAQELLGLSSEAELEIKELTQEESRPS